MKVKLKNASEAKPVNVENLTMMDKRNAIFFFGKGGSGKTALILWLCKQMLEIEEVTEIAPNFKIRPISNVLYYYGEGGEMVNNRILAAFGRDRRVDFGFSAGNPLWNLKVWQEILNDYIIDTGQSPDMVVIDTLQNHGGSDESLYSKGGTIAMNANILADQYNCTIFIAHHSLKGSEDTFKGPETLRDLMQCFKTKIIKKGENANLCLMTDEKLKDLPSFSVYYEVLWPDGVPTARLANMDQGKEQEETLAEKVLVCLMDDWDKYHTKSGKLKIKPLAIDATGKNMTSVPVAIKTQILYTYNYYVSSEQNAEKSLDTIEEEG